MADDTSNAGQADETRSPSSAEEDSGAADAAGSDAASTDTPGADTPRSDAPGSGATPEADDANPEPSRPEPPNDEPRDENDGRNPIASQGNERPNERAEQEASDEADENDAPLEASDQAPPYGEPFVEWLYAPGPYPMPCIQHHHAGEGGFKQTIWLITMATDYMEPELIMGDTVAVEIEQDFDAPDTYFFQIGDAYQVARLEETRIGSVRIVPANPFYSPMTVDPVAVQLQVHGRVWGRVHRV